MRLLAAVPLLLLAAPGLACEAVTVGDITVEHAWSRASISADRPGIIYVTIRNEGSEDDALVAIATPAASMPMLHETVVTDGVARMPHAMSVPVPAGETVMLEPGGLHAMLNDLTTALDEGTTFPATLTFEAAGDVTIDVEVVGLAGTGPACEQ